MSLRLTQSLSQTLSPLQLLSQRLSLEQRLLRRVHGADEVYRPAGTCSNCSRRLTPAEIIRGFNRNANDFTTKCPKCKKRFAPQLVAASSVARVEMPFYCAMQTTGMLTAELASVALMEFKKTYASIYRSAVYHFGSLKAAFEKVGLTYSQEPKVSSWQKKIMSFLGKLPDQIIASTANVPLREVRALRKERRIEPYRRGQV